MALQHSKQKYGIGMVGLKVSGSHPVLNFAGHGISVASLDRDRTTGAAPRREVERGDACGAADTRESISLLRRPRAVVSAAARLGPPAPVLMTSLGYMGRHRSSWLPANLNQGRRDFSGSRTYERADAMGPLRTVWENTRDL